MGVCLARLLAVLLAGATLSAHGGMHSVEAVTPVFAALLDEQLCGSASCPDRTAAMQATSAVTSARETLSTSAVAEMLTAPDGRFQRWTRVPELVVITTVLAYHTGASATYVATSEQLNDEDADDIARDLVEALTALTGDRTSRFVAVSRESVREGTSVSVLRPGRIVVGRFRDVREHTQTIGLGGRTTRADGTITSAAIILDSDYDRTSPRRRLVRTHELGHAFGLNHVRSTVSVMNPTVGPEPNDFDRAAAALAFPSALYPRAQ